MNSEALLWPPSRTSDALAALASEAGLETRTLKHETLVSDVEFAARLLNLEAQTVEISYSNFERLLPALAPALFRVTRQGGEGFLAILPNSIALTPDLQKIRMAPAAIRSLVCSGSEAGAANEVE